MLMTKSEAKFGSSESKENSGSASVQKNKDGDRYIDVGLDLYTLQYSIAQIEAAARLMVQLAGNKRATVRQFKGKTLVDIREVSCIPVYRMQKYGVRRFCVF